MTDDISEQREALHAVELIELGELKIRSSREGDVHTIVLLGELDLATAPVLEEELKRVEATDAASIVLDLSGLAFMDSSGVRLLVTAHSRSRTRDRGFSLVRGPAAVQRVLELSGVDELLPFAD